MAGLLAETCWRHYKCKYIIILKCICCCRTCYNPQALQINVAVCSWQFLDVICRVPSLRMSGAIPPNVIRLRCVHSYHCTFLPLPLSPLTQCPIPCTRCNITSNLPGATRNKNDFYQGGRPTFLINTSTYHPVKSGDASTEEGNPKRCYQLNRLHGVTRQNTSVSVSHISRKKGMQQTVLTVQMWSYSVVKRTVQTVQMWSYSIV